MSMKNTKFTGLLTRKKAVRYLIYILFVCVFAVFVIKLNQVEKTELVVRTGQTFEKAKVVKILQDNLEENGTRVGEQKVRVRMLTGVRKGEELDITVMRCFLESVILYPVGTDVALSNGETARIVENVPNAVLRPKVLGLTTGKVYDLANDVKCANVIIL
jgi:uncharacterized membrane protein